MSPRIRARINEKAAERRQKCGADAIGSRRSTNLSPPPGACGLFAAPTLGLTPQAKNMPRLRRSNQGVTPEGLHGSSTLGANLFQDALYFVSCILHLVSGRVTGRPQATSPRSQALKSPIPRDDGGGCPPPCPTDPVAVAVGLGGGLIPTRVTAYSLARALLLQR